MMKANKVKQNYPKYKKVSTNIKGDLLLDDNFSTHHSKDDTEAVSFIMSSGVRESGKGIF